MEYITLLPTVVIGVLWYLLKQKDDKQEKAIEKLFIMHDDDVKELSILKLKIAENHYPKVELDIKFQCLEVTTREGFKELGMKFDKLTDALMAHITHSKGQ